MKYKYCDNCKKAYLRSRLEKDNCMYCNQPAKTVDVKRNSLYYLGYGIMVAGAGSALAPRVIELSGSSFYFAMGLVLVIAGTILVMMGSVRMAQTAAKIVLNEQDDE